MTQYPSTPSRTEDVIHVLHDLNGYADRLVEDTPEEARSQRRYTRFTNASLVLLLCAFVLLVASLFVTLSALRAVTSVLILVAAGVSLYANIRVVREQPRVFRALRRPRQALMNRLEEVLELEEAAVRQLLAYDLATLQFVRARLAQAVEVSKERTETVLGPVGKPGLFPAVLAAAVAALSALRGAPLWAQVVAVGATFLLILNQNTATTVQMGLTDARLMFGLLDQAIGVREGLEAAPAQAHPSVQAEERELAQV